MGIARCWEIESHFKLGTSYVLFCKFPYYIQKADVFQNQSSNQKDNLRLRQSVQVILEILSAKIKGYEPDTFVYPTVEDGVEGMKFVKACLQSDANNNIWVNVFD